MKAVIIAGGLGTRLRPLTYNTPKPIVPVVNRPFVVHQIELLKQHGIDEIILNLHYLSDNIRELLDDGVEWGIKIRYSIEETPLGTAGAVKNAEEYFKDEEAIVVFNGDILTDANISEIIKFHKEKKASATLTLTPVEDPTAYGLVLCDEDGRVRQFLEKPSWERVEGLAKKNINAGIYVLDPKIFANVPKGKPIMFEHHLFPQLLESGAKVFGFETSAYWIDIGNPEKYRAAHQAVLRGEVTLVRVFGQREKGGIWIDHEVEAEKTAKIYGPSIIGRKVKIGDNAAIRGYSVIGERVTIGRSSVIEDSIIWSGCKIGANVKLNGCVVGYDCVIEDGVSLTSGGILADRTVLGRGTIIGN